MTTTLESLKKEILEQVPLLIEQGPAFCAALARALRGKWVAGERLGIEMYSDSIDVPAI